MGETHPSQKSMELAFETLGLDTAPLDTAPQEVLDDDAVAKQQYDVARMIDEIDGRPGEPA